MINFLLNFAVRRYYFTALKLGDSFGSDGVFFVVMLSGSEISQFNVTFVRTKVTKSRRDLFTLICHAAKAGIPALAKASKSGRPLSLALRQGGVTSWGVPCGKAG